MGGTSLSSIILLAWAVQLQAQAAPPSPALPAAPAAPAPTASLTDPAVLRLKLLHALDDQIDLAAARAHLDARLTLDVVIPIPYLGVDADTFEEGMLVSHVYPLTAAEAAGLQPGDVLLSLSGAATTSKVTLGAAIRSHQVGDAIELRARREGAELLLHSTLGQRPEEDEDEDEQFPDLAQPPAPPPAPVAFDFEAEASGSTPSRLEILLGGHGAPASFVVVGEPGEQCLKQDSNDTTGIRFPLAIVRDFSAGDVVGRARFRFAGGRVDKAAGVVLRYRDPFNYLVARANAAEADLRIFRVANGVRRTLPGAVVKAPCDDDAWHTLEFRAVGTELTATMDGTIVATTHDAWFLEGGVGLWTKSDSLNEFDDVGFAAQAP